MNLLIRTPTERLVADYELAAIGHAKYTLEASSRKTNRCANKMIRIEKELSRRGEILALLSLLDHIDPSVRVWAATHLFLVSPERARKVLEVIAKGPRGPTRLSAEVFLQYNG